MAETRPSDFNPDTTAVVAGKVELSKAEFALTEKLAQVVEEFFQKDENNNFVSKDIFDLVLERYLTSKLNAQENTQLSLHTVKDPLKVERPTLQLGGMVKFNNEPTRFVLRYKIYEDIAGEQIPVILNIEYPETK